VLDECIGDCASMDPKRRAGDGTQPESATHGWSLVVSLNGLHDPQQRMSVNVLQWKIHEVRFRIDGDRVCVRHMELTKLAKVAIALLQYRNCAGFR
jgi:hypothetical protein